MFMYLRKVFDFMKTVNLSIRFHEFGATYTALTIDYLK